METVYDLYTTYYFNYNFKVSYVQKGFLRNFITAFVCLLLGVLFHCIFFFLQILLSMLVHLHRLCRTDIVSDISTPDSFASKISWPSSLDGSPVSTACVTLALRETLTHCLILQPKNKSWLRTQVRIVYQLQGAAGSFHRSRIIIVCQQILN